MGRKRYVFKSPDWWSVILAGAATPPGQQSSKWHYDRLGSADRGDILEWATASADVARVPSYRLTRLWLARKICQVTTGLSYNDARFFYRRIGKLLPPGV